MVLLVPFSASVSQGPPGKQTYLGVWHFLRLSLWLLWHSYLLLSFVYLLCWPPLSFLYRCFGGSALQKVVIPKGFTTQSSSLTIYKWFLILGRRSWPFVNLMRALDPFSSWWHTPNILHRIWASSQTLWAYLHSPTISLTWRSPTHPWDSAQMATPSGSPS